MSITELTIAATGDLHIAWEISEGTQSAFDLFLLQKGSVIKRLRTESAVTECVLCADVNPMIEYSLLLTVRCNGCLSTARMSFVIEKEHKLRQSVLFHTVN